MKFTQYKNMLTRYLLALFCCFSAAVNSANYPLNKEKIVTIDGSITEIVFSLNAGDQVVAVDETSLFPPSVNKLPNVGYLRSLSAEGILSTDANHIITTQDAGPAEIIEQIRAAGVPITIVDQPHSEQGLYNKIRRVSEIIQRQDEGQRLIENIQTELDNLKAQRNNQAKPSVLFIMSQRGRGLKVSGKGTRADALIRVSGGENVISTFSSYKPLTPESLLSLDPDVILLLANRGASTLTEEVPLISLTSAHKNNKIFTLTRDDLIFGPRLASVAKKIQTWLYE